ncbi:hypothetical protein BGZ54_005879 [Gamsiella multidivaricata]|nr:hypothetical protein BGZ54_005879 [Gamsiella multidivaricata]
MLLGTSDTTLATFHQGLAQLYLDTLQYSHQQTQQKARLAAFRRSEIEAQAGLDRLIELKRQLALQRETEGDIEQRTRRRSAELSRIRAVEDQETLQHILKTHQNSDLNIEAHGLSVAQLDSKERTVAELQAQSEAQAKMLAAYQEIPPDYTLAKLKLTEATMRLNELTAKHEALLTELANDL